MYLFAQNNMYKIRCSNSSISKAGFYLYTRESAITQTRIITIVSLEVYLSFCILRNGVITITHFTDIIVFFKREIVIVTTVIAYSPVT